MCLTLCNLMDCKPVRLLFPWDCPGKNTGVGSSSWWSSDAEIEPTSPALQAESLSPALQADSLLSEPPEKPLIDLQWSVNITLIIIGKPTISWDSLYCDICFIVVIWHQTHDTSEVCLYLPPPTFVLHVPSSTPCLCLVGEDGECLVLSSPKASSPWWGLQMEEEEKEAHL